MVYSSSIIAMDKIVDEAVKDTLAHRSDHTYSYEEMGFTREKIVELYADIFERFGFDTREEKKSTRQAQLVTVASIE